MPRSAKKRKEEPPTSSSSSDGDEDQDTIPEENIQIDLEARSPTEADHSAILYFLEQSFGGTSPKRAVLDQAATQLISQSTFGSVFYQPLDATEDDTDDDDDDSPVLGVCSFLRFDQPQNKALHNWFLDKCAEHEQAKTFLQNSKCGLLVNERYMNIPAEISLPALRTLREEMLFPVDYWLVHAKVRAPKSDPKASYYLNGEEELFNAHAAVTIEYQPSQPGAGDWTEKRRILFVSTAKLEEICAEIEQKLQQE